jgi:hypothetical protein
MIVSKICNLNHVTYWTIECIESRVKMRYFWTIEI